MSTELSFIYGFIHDTAKVWRGLTPRYVQNWKVLTEFVYKKYCTTHEVLADDFHSYNGCRLVCVCEWLKDFPRVSNEQQWSDTGRGLWVWNFQRLGSVIGLIGFNRLYNNSGNVEADGNWQHLGKRLNSVHEEAYHVPPMWHTVSYMHCILQTNIQQQKIWLKYWNN